MAREPGNGLIMAGAIVSIVGVCIVLVQVLRVPAYWVPLIVGLGLMSVGLIRRFIRGR
jgi:hypothetical protein